jgi:tetratricopeptide (TPR) repeat protein
MTYNQRMNSIHRLILRHLRRILDPTKNLSRGRARLLPSRPHSLAALLTIGFALTVLSACGSSKPKPETEPATTTARMGRTDAETEQAAYYFFMEGTTLREEGNIEGAAQAFERALQFDPWSNEIRLSLGDCYFTMRRFERAIAVVEGATVRDRRVIEFLGRCHRFLGHDTEAGALYRELVRLDTTDAEAWWYLSRLELRQGHLEQAADDLEHLAHLRDDARVFTELGDLRSRIGQYDRAVEAFRASLRIDSSWSGRDAWIGLAGALEPLGQFPEAVAAYRNVIAMSPPTELTAHRRLVQLFLAADQPDSAAAVIEDILRQRPDDPERIRLGILWYSLGQEEKAESLFIALEGQVDPYVSLFYRGRIAADRNDYTEAKSFFRRAIAQADTIPDAWIHLGQALLNQDSLDDAIATAHRAIAVTGDTRGFWYFMGVAFSRAEQYDSAVYWLDKLWREDTLNSRVQFSLGAALERSGQFDRAVAMFRGMIAREPNNAIALNYLGYMYADSGIHLEESLELIGRALQEEPDNGAYLDSYGWALFRLGRLDEAESEIRKALENLQSDPTIHDHLGDILAALGRKDEAVTHWRKALELEPDSEEIKQKLGL